MATPNTQNPFDFGGIPGATPGSAGMYQQPPQYQQQQYPPQQQQYQQPPQQQPQQQQQQQQPQQQLVVATQPSNPYAGIVPPQQQQWGAPAPAADSGFVAAPPSRASTASAASFDPFAAPPPPPAPAPAAYQASPTPQRQVVYQDPWATAASQTPQTNPPPPVAQPPAQQQQQQSYPGYSNDNNYQAPAPASYPMQNNRSMNGPPRPPTSTSLVVRDNARNGNNNDDDDGYKNANPRNPYSEILAQEVQGSNTSGLPKAHLVGKKGFVLSRISFRTIVMKKWKQSFWVQYGGHTMLWFRSQADFDDWLNNPYHTQLQRNFLIKLAINFVHDLYKPNVRGYQVTQCRTKPYGNNKVVRQFKLERWMDYGPTIAAAFGSYDPKEVDACREAIVECMKNTPLDNGIRATGAVKEHHDRKQQEEEREIRRSSQSQQNGYNNYTLNQAPARPKAPSVDLLGDTTGSAAFTNGSAPAFDDTASLPAVPASNNDFFGGDPNARALVPAVNPNTAYPGAPSAAYYGQAQGYPSQQQYQQAPAPAFAQQAAPAPAYEQHQAPAFAQQAAPAPAYEQHQAPAPAYGQQQAPAPAYGQQQAPAPSYGQQQASAPSYGQQQAPAPAYGQQPGGYPQQQQQQPGGYPAAAYPVPTQQF